MKRKLAKTREGECITQLILETFRLNGLLHVVGDGLTRDLGLTSALWQVMGAIGDEPLHLAQIARNMGLTRQSVRRSARVLEQRGFACFLENPNHKRARLLGLTGKGREILSRVNDIQTHWSNGLADGLNSDELSRAVQLMQTISERLNQQA